MDNQYVHGILLILTGLGLNVVDVMIYELRNKKTGNNIVIC